MFVITGATGNIGKPVAEILLAERKDVRVIGRSADRLKDLVDKGEVAPDVAEYHPMSNVITRALCKDDSLDDLDVSQYALEPGDTVLACSDGLWKVGEDAFTLILRQARYQEPLAASLNSMARTLVDEALMLGSDDNVSVALWHWHDEKRPADGLRKTRMY